MKKLAALLLLALLAFCLVSCDSEPDVKTMTITIHDYDGTVLATVNDVPTSIKTWAELINSKYNTFDGISYYGGYVTLVKFNAYMGMGLSISDLEGVSHAILSPEAHSTNGILLGDELQKDVYISQSS